MDYAPVTYIVANFSREKGNGEKLYTQGGKKLFKWPKVLAYEEV